MRLNHLTKRRATRQQLRRVYRYRAVAPYVTPNAALRVLPSFDVPGEVIPFPGFSVKVV